MRLRTARLAAVLLPASIVLHEGAYALVGGGLLGAHGYLELAVPLAFALAASLALAALLLPAIGVRGEGAERWAPLAIAAALAGIFCVQELAEALLFGGGWTGFAASAAVAWLVPPLALLLGALSSATVLSLAVAGELIASLAARSASRRVQVEAVWRPSPLPFVPVAACAGLAFGFARRPPPARG